MSAKNIVIFGQTGAGKSSVVNLMAGKKQADTSPDAQPCTTHWEEHSIPCHDEYNLRVFDTVGLQEQQNLPCDAIENARSLITNLDNEGGIDLLLFCVREPKFTPTIESNYRRFYIDLLSKKEKRIPIVLVVTGLEREQNMEDWWTRNEDTLKSKIAVDGHACITAADNPDQGLYKHSRELISNLVKEHTQISLPNFEQGSISVKNIVLFGQTGAGKSSLVNLMAEGERAATSLGTERCTMHWEEYPIAFDGCNYKVFDTVGLEEPQLGIKEYLNVIVNARSLIMKLDKEGGIDLLLFCVRAGRLSATLQNNYRLFYEWLCEKKVPIVLVITGLEREGNMEDWWTRYKGSFDRLNIVVDGHACITLVNLGGNYERLYEESRHLVHNLVKQYTRGGSHGGWKGGEGLFRSFMRSLRELILGDRSIRKKDALTILTKRCGMPPEAAAELAKKVREELAPK